MARTDYYAVLGITRESSEDEIRSAYRKLARQYHPDVNKAEEASVRFREVTEAYEVLADPQRRQRYDMFGSTDGAVGFGIDDLFNTFFGGEMRRRERGPMRGADLRMQLEIELIDAVRGGDRTIKVPRLESCERCGGDGKTVDKVCTRCRGEGRERKERDITLTIPAGIDDGQQLRVAGEGEAGMRGGPSGDLYVLIRMQEHPRFKREGDDLVHVLRISPAQAALGDELEVPTIDGQRAKVRVPAGAQHGQAVRLKAKGVPHLGSSGRGDQLVYLDVVIPRTLTKDQKTLYQKLHAASGIPEQSEDDRGVFDRIKDALI